MAFKHGLVVFVCLHLQLFISEGTVCVVADAEHCIDILIVTYRDSKPVHWSKQMIAIIFYFSCGGSMGGM